METVYYDLKVDVSISVPIIGDESIMLVQPPDGFEFRKYLLDEYKFKSNLLDGANKLRVDYLFAIHGENEKSIVCLELEKTIMCKHNKPIRSIEFINGDDFEIITDPIHRDLSSQLWRFFAMLHLFKEGEISQKQAFYTYIAKDGCVTSKINRPSVCADTITLIRYPMIILPSEIVEINAFMISHDQSYNMLKRVVIDTLEYTYHVLDDVTNFKNITTPLEVLFLKKGEKGKKVNLSSRISVFLGSSDLEITNIDNRVKQLYSDRGAATHEGKSPRITRASLDELRNLLRQVTKKYMILIDRKIALNPTMDFSTIKQELIADLQKEVAIKKAAGVLP